MSRLKYILIALGILIPVLVYAAPTTNYFLNIAPTITDTYNNGTSALRWLNFFTKYASTTQLTVSGQTSGCAQLDSTGFLTSTGSNCASSSTFGTTSISALYPLVWNTTTAVLSFLGLGTTTPWTAGQIAVVSNGNTLYSTPTTTATCTGTNSCTQFTVLGNSPISILGTADGTFSTTSANFWASLGLAFSTTSSNFWSSVGLGFSTSSVNYWKTTQWFNTYPFINNATSSLLTFTGGIIVNNATSSITNVVIGNSTTTNATTTSLALVGGAANCNGTNALTTNSTGVVGCTAQPQGTVTSVTATFPIVSSGGATPVVSFNGLSTSTAAVQGNIPYFSGVNTFANVATGTLTLSSPLSGGPFTVIGTGGAVTCPTCSTATFGYPFTPTANFNTTMSATSTPLWARLGIYASSTSVIASTTFDGATGNVGIGISSPLNLLTVSKQPTIQAAISGSIAQFVGQDANPLRITFDTHNNANTSGTAFMFRRSRGTAATPLQVQQDDVLGSLNFRGYGLTAYAAGSTALMTAKAEGIFTDTSMPTAIAFDTTATTSVSATEKLRITGAGNVGIGTTSPLAKLSILIGGTYTAQAASTAFSIGSSTAGTATSTLFSVTSNGSTTLFQIPSSILKTDTNGTIIAAVAGQDYLTSANLFAYPFPAAGNIATTSPIMLLASTTIGSGTQTGGLTVNGGATTTGFMLIGNSPIFNGATLISSATDNLYVSTTSTNTARAALFTSAYTGPGGAVAMQGSNAQAIWSSSATGNNTTNTVGGGLRGSRNVVNNTSAGYNVASSSAFSGNCSVGGTLASSTDCYAYNAENPTVGSGNLLSNSYGLNVAGGTVTGTLTNHYGVYINDLISGTTRYGIYQVGASDLNYFGGKVGIGTTTPTAKLTIGSGSSGLNGSTVAMFGDVAAGSTVNALSLVNAAAATVGNEATLNFMLSNTNNATAAIKASLNSTGGGADTDIIFQSRLASGALGERMRIASTGNEGISSTTPWARLSITNPSTAPALAIGSGTNGTVSQFIVDQNGNVGIGTTTPDNLLSVEQSTNAGLFTSVTNPNSGSAAFTNLSVKNGYGVTEGLRFDTFGTAFTTSGLNLQDGAKISAASGLSGGLSIGSLAASAPLIFFTNAAEVARFTSTGNFGIATTTPGSLNGFTAGLSLGGAAPSITLNSNGQTPWEVGSDVNGKFRIIKGTALAPFTIDTLGKVGIATTTPWSTLSVVGNGTVPPFVVSTSTSNNVLPNFEIDVNGHVVTSGPKPTCTTACTFLEGNDNAFRIVTGSAVLTETVTFAHSWGTSAPICQATEGGNTATPTVIAASTTPTTVVLTNAALTSKDIDVSCEGIQ